MYRPNHIEYLLFYKFLLRKESNKPKLLQGAKHHKYVRNIDNLYEQAKLSQLHSLVLEKKNVLHRSFFKFKN